MADNSSLLREHEAAAMFYAESWALAHMLKLSPAYAPRFPQLLEHLTSGMLSVQALEAVYARPLDSIDRDLHNWFPKDRSTYLPPPEVSDPVSIDLSEVSSATVHSMLTEIVNTANMLNQ
jgi:hypothetical protein